MDVPGSLNVAIALIAFQAHRVAPFTLVSKLADGSMTAGAWLVPAMADCTLGVLAPFVCYGLAHAPSYNMWALAIAFNAIGIFNYCMSLLVDSLYGAPRTVLGRSRDRSGYAVEIREKSRFPYALSAWLLANLLAQSYALRSLFDEAVPGHLEHEFMMGTEVVLGDGPLHGNWRWICLLGWSFVGVPTALEWLLATVPSFFAPPTPVPTDRSGMF